MISSILILTLVGGAFITSIIFPIHLPAVIISTIDIYAQYIWMFDGIIPVEEWMFDISFMIFVTMMFGVARIVIGLLALATGGGKPEI